MNIFIDNVFKKIDNNQDIAIISSQNPDLDGIACILAIKKLLEHVGHLKTTYAIYGKLQREAKWTLDYLKISLEMTTEIENKRIVLVDASDKNSLPNQDYAKNVNAVLDHRLCNFTDFPQATYWIESVGACATLVAELYMYFCIEPDQVIASLLYGAILSNTANLHATNTTDRDRSILKWIQCFAKLPSTFVYDMFSAKSDFAEMSFMEIIKDELSCTPMTYQGLQMRIPQLEIVGVQSFLDKHMNGFRETFDIIKKAHDCDRVFLMIIDLEYAKTYFAFASEYEKEIVCSRLQLQQNGTIWFSDSVILRKEVIKKMS